MNISEPIARFLCSAVAAYLRDHGDRGHRSCLAGAGTESHS